ncbi:MAG: glucose-6-phosphate isomerase [Kineosporiaceae bacterium]
MSAAAEAVADPVADTVATLVADGVASRIAAQDPGVWGEAARTEAALRLGWTGLHRTSRDLVQPVRRLRDELRGEGVDRVVLCGMGGSSLAPEVVCAGAGVDLVVLDGTDPGQVRSALVDLDRTVVVVSSKSGGTVETDSQRRAFAEAFTRAGIDPARRLVVVTDPGSPLEATAREGGYRAVFAADPSVGGRYSALTAFGLVPSGLAGADVERLLDEAAAVADALGADDPGNPALRLGGALAATPGPGGPRDKIVLVGSPDDGLPGFGDWAEQLVAESTGKQGRGLLPVVVGPGAPEAATPPGDCLVVRTRSGTGGLDVEGPVVGADTAQIVVTGPLGAQFLLWEYATAVAGRLLGINPFDQPDVESAKVAARELLDAGGGGGARATGGTGGDVTVTALGLDVPAADVGTAVTALIDRVGPDGYLAVMAYLDRGTHPGLPAVRDALAARTGRPVTFGWGPRFLHSTGQYHKGGPSRGAFVQVVAGDGYVADEEVPGRGFTFGGLIAAQAAGDARVLAEHGMPVLTLAVRTPAGLQAAEAALSGAGA